MSEYDAILDAEQGSVPKPSASPYDSVLDAEVQQTQQRARTIFEKALAVNPDQAAQSKKLAGATGLPPDVVARNLDDVRRKEQARMLDLARMAQDSPVLARQLLDPTFTNQTHDDLSTLGSIEQFIRDSGSSVKAGVYNANKGAAGLFRAGFELVAPALDALEPVTAIGGNPLRRIAEGFALNAENSDALAKAAAPKTNGVVSSGVQSGIQSLTQNVLMLPMAFLPGGQGAALSGMVATTGGQSYQDARAKGLSMSQALPFAASQAAIEYATEKLPLDTLIGGIKQGAPFLQTLAKQMALEIPGEQIATALQDMNEWAVLNPGKPFNDYLAERPNAALQTLITTVVGTGGNVVIANGVQAATNRLMGDAYNAGQAENSADYLQQQLALAGQALLRERNPSEFRALVQKMADGTEGAPKEVFVDAEVLNQLAPEVIATLPESVRAALPDALMANDAVAIPVADVLTVAPGTPLEQMLVENARIGDPRAMSQKEAKEAGAKAQEYLSQESARVIQQAQDQAATQASHDVVRQQVLDQLNAVGRFRKEVNEGYATWTAAFYTTMAGRMGMTPEQMAAQYPLRIVGQGAGELNQITPEQALETNVPLDLPADPLFTEAVGNTPGAQVTENGLLIDLVRFQKPEQEGAQAIRTGVFYLPAKSADVKHYRNAKTGYGGAERFAGPTLIRRPLFVKGATGGKAPEQAYVQLKGKEAFKALDHAVMQVVLKGGYWGVKRADKVQLIEEFLDQYAPEQAGNGQDIESVSREGNTLRYALQELAIATEVRAAGYDAVVGFSSGKAGPRISEVFDVREQTFPARGMDSQVHDAFAQSPTAQTDTPAFKAWFGDSKVVDAQGKPLVVYHGTRTGGFDTFKPNTRKGEQLGFGIHFAVDEAFADKYANDASIARKGKAPQVYATYLKASNPLLADVIVFDGTPEFALAKRLAGGKLFTMKDETGRLTAYMQNAVDATSPQRAEKLIREAGYDAVRYVSKVGTQGVGASVTGKSQSWIVFNPTQIKSATGNSGEFNPNDPSILNQAAYHGSPHDFQHFSLEHIGTGEGAQAYGWGLYFAEDRKVAAGYYAALADQPGLKEMKLGSLTMNERNGFDYSRRASENTRENIRASLAEDLMINENELHAVGKQGFQAFVLKTLDEKLDEYRNQEPPYTEGIKAGEELRKMLAAPGAVSIAFHPTVGGVYSVDIPDDATARMLLWDKPLSEQPESVRKALKKLKPPAAAEWVKRGEGYDYNLGGVRYGAVTPDGDKFAANVDGPGNVGVFATMPEAMEAVQAQTSDPKMVKAKAVFKPATTGEQIYNELTHSYGSDKDASEALAAVGIPGLKYLDGNNRDSGQGAHNIVLWDQPTIDRMNKQVEKALYQGQSKARGTFNPANLELALNENADLSTFLHETGHFFLEVMDDLASQPNAPADIVADMDVLLKWFGVDSADTWRAMTLEQKRPYHERFAESIEQYLMEGRAPSVELQPLFRKFRAWLLNVYKSLKSFIASRRTVTAGGETLAQMPVDSEAFKKWFGDSKVVDAQGKPLVVYHGTRRAFDIFAPSEPRGAIGNPRGIYFTADKSAAEEYAQDNEGAWDEKSRVIAAYIKIADDADGKIIDSAYRGREYVVFKPENIKSATGNNGEFNPNDPSILKQGDQPTGPDIQLSDEVRQVFDRMLASEEQIAQANEVAGLLPDEDADYAAVEKLSARSLRDLKWSVNARAKEIKKLQAQAKTLRKEVEAEVRAEVDAMPVFQAKDALDKLRKETKAPPTDADLANVADAFQYPTVEEMLQEISAAGRKADVIEGMTDQRMLERHGDLIDQRAIEAAANEAVHNEARARSLATELKSQADMLNPRSDTGRVNARGAKITVNTLVEAAKQFGANVVSKTPIKDLKAKAWQHTAAERRASKRWQEATAAGKTEEAVKAKQDQMLNNAAAKASMEAQAEMRKMLEFFKRVIKDGNEKTVEKGRDPDVVNAARAVLGAYGIAPKGAKNANDYMALVEKNDPAMFAALQPSVQAAMDMAQPLDALTMDQLRGLHEEIQGMWYLAKRSRQMEIDGDMLDMDEAENQLQDRMQAIGVPDSMPGDSGAVTPREEFARKLQHAASLLRRTEQWAQGMGSEFTKLVFQPVKDAADRYRSDRVVYRKKYQALVDAVAPALLKGVVAAPEIGYTFGRGHNGIGHAELLHAILHTGNESNKRKLLLGRGWATKNEDGTLDTTRWDAFIKRAHDTGILNKVHYDFAQGVWDLLEETKPLAQKTHRDVFGRYFAEITADSFETPFGTYKGGYVPAQADPRIVADADLRKLAELENENMAFSFPGTNKGFTKSRVEYNRPLMLDLRTIGQHIDKVLLFSHMEPAVRDVNKLLSRKGVSYSLSRIDPTIYAGMLTPWLNRSARQIVETPVVGDGGISRVLSAARSRAGMSLMFANVSNTIQQLTGFSTAALKVQPANMLAATAQFIANPKKMSKTVGEASAFMANRMENEISAINDAMDKILLDPNLYERAQAWTQKHAYFMQTAMANTMEPIIWTAAYNEALKDGQSERDAVRHADSVIRTTQGSTLPEDVSRIETGPAYARVFTQFVGYFNMMANTNATALKQLAQEEGLRKGAGKALGIVTVGMLIPIWVAEAIAVAMRGGPDDPDKDGYLDDWLAAVFGMGTIKGTFAMVPFAGQLATAGMNRFNGNPADDKMSLSPAVSILEAAAGVPVDVYKAITDPDKLNRRNAVRDVASAVSIATGFPASALARPIGYLAGVADNKIKPTDPVDLVRGTVTGTPSPASR